MFASLATGYIGLISTVQRDTVFMMELKECSKRIYKIPQFIYYTIGYAIERVLSMSRKGISTWIPRKIKSQQLNLFDFFSLEDYGEWSC